MKKGDEKRGAAGGGAGRPWAWGSMKMQKLEAFQYPGCREGYPSWGYAGMPHNPRIHVQSAEPTPA